MRTAHMEKAAMGRSQWDHSFMTLLALIAVADPACHHCMGSLIALHPGQLSPQWGWHVRAAFSARWLCYIPNSARKMSILSLK